ncbi:auxin response factor 24-like isoform X2 [Euphorbia lathyris]|uniref:auxin response factor 24-like isoform X2 n=1 Tax=Euphorbia lathyris TaxID=212925 RepID=UPI0033140EF9
MGKGNVINQSEGRTINNHFPNNRHVGEDNLSTELWRSCAGPFVNVPKAGDMVFYLPQAHMEQVEACMNQDGQMEMPVYNLPYSILCKVLSVELKAEAATDEVFAQIALIPVAKQNGLSSMEDGNSLSSHRKTYAKSFSKKLTSSDTSTHGGFSVLKRHAEECLPPLDMSRDPPEQKLIAKDLHGTEWCFRHVFRGNPKRHLLTTGWSKFVTSRKLIAGDTLIFLRGNNGELRIGVRRAMKLQNNASTTVISASCMRHGILAAAFHAITTGTMFIVYYRPWTSPTEFIIPFDQYIKSAEINYSVGTRITMLFEGEECQEQEQRIERCEGTIVAIEDVDHARWPNSEWRSLKVEWNDNSDGIERPERVSPWNIEPIEPVERKHSSPLHPSKRARLVDASLPGFPSVAEDGLLHGLVENAAQYHLEVFQGQERDTGMDELGTLIPPIIPYLVPPNPDSDNNPLESGDQLCFPVHGPIYPCPNGSKNLPVLNASSYCSGSPDQRTLERKDANEIPHAPPCMVFGVNFNPPELPSPQVFSDHDSHDSVPPMSPSSVSQPLKSSSGPNSVHQYENSPRRSTNLHCIKVFKYGSAGRSVDLTRFDGYVALKCQLDQMFEFNGSLVDGNSGWQVTYSDKDGDTMLIGDYPWQDFLCSVRRMFICRKEDIGKLISCSPIRMPLE